MHNIMQSFAVRPIVQFVCLTLGTIPSVVVSSAAAASFDVLSILFILESVGWPSLWIFSSDRKYFKATLRRRGESDCCSEMLSFLSIKPDEYGFFSKNDIAPSIYMRNQRYKFFVVPF